MRRPFRLVLALLGLLVLALSTTACASNGTGVSAGAYGS
jgi:hypothetical protein